MGTHLPARIGNPNSIRYQGQPHTLEARWEAAEVMEVMVVGGVLHH